MAGISPEESRSDLTPLIVIGLSAGGIEPLGTLLEGLPHDLGAAILVTMHMGQARPTHLPEILGRRTDLPVRAAQDGDPVEAGQVLIAPPGAHTRIRDGSVTVSTGPRHNGYRPSIDASFLSSARSRHTPLIAVLLSGAGSDGISGASAVKASGGWLLVQDPDEATFSALPQGAVERTTPDAVLISAQMSDWLVDHIEERGIRRPIPHEDDIEWTPTGLSCPDCGGVLWEDTGLSDLRCRIGHEWSEAAVEMISATRIEDGLETALRILEEQIAFDNRLLLRAADQEDREGAARRIEGRIREREKVASELQGLLDKMKAVSDPAR